MTIIEVSADRDYQVVIVDNWINELRNAITDAKAIAIVPSSLYERVHSQVPDLEILQVPDGEAQKSFEIYQRTLAELAGRRLDRSALIIGIGGGATTDLAGFVAATYLRGINWIAIPTTIAGMVDAAIGGKTGINLDVGKNLVGAFYSPNRVIVDLSWVQGLSIRDRNAGLAEAVKCGLIADPLILDAFDAGIEENLFQIVSRSIAVKARVVSADFKESFEREALNYGHTLGHAVEQHSDYELRHGEAISIGMVFAAHLSMRYAGLEPAVTERQLRILQHLDLPTSYPATAWAALYQLMLVDKKRRGEALRFVTLPTLGKTDRFSSTNESELRDIYQTQIAR